MFVKPCPRLAPDPGVFRKPAQGGYGPRPLALGAAGPVSPASALAVAGGTAAVTESPRFP